MAHPDYDLNYPGHADYAGGTYSNAPALPPITLESITSAVNSVRAISERYEQIRRSCVALWYGRSPMVGRRFAYDSREWSRLQAWQHLTQQHIPGAPLAADNVCRVPWRKDHNEARHEWAWIYVG